MTPHALIAPARLAGASLMRAQSDERLVDLVRAGNDAAFEAIVARHRRPLQRYCARILSESRAEDAVQQSFLSAYNYLRSSSGEMKLRPWLYRIGHNTSLNMLRERGTTFEQLSEEIDGVERPDQAAERSERLREVVSAVNSLPGRQRDAIRLRELEGRSYEEIAVQLGVSGGAVRQLLSRARTTLRAGASALTPYELAARVPWSAGPGQTVADRIGDLCAAGAGGALAVKACASVMVAGAMVGGVVGAPTGDPSGAAHDDRPAAARAAPRAAAASGAPEGGSGHRAAGRRRGGRSNRPPGSGRREGGGGDLSGAQRRSRSGADDRRGEDHSGSGSDAHSGRGEGDSSGPGSGDRTRALGGDRSGGDSSGGDDSTGDHSGGGDSGSPSSESGSSGSGSSRSGSSGSGSGSGESSGSGSDSSGAGSADDALSGRDG